MLQPLIRAEMQSPLASRFAGARSGRLMLCALSVLWGCATGSQDPPTSPYAERETEGTGDAGGTMLLEDGPEAPTEGAAALDGGAHDPLTGCGSNLTGVVRDFRADHPDFECSKQTPTPYTDPSNKVCGPWDPQIVGAIGSAIGPNRKPAYAATTDTPSTNGAPAFAQWFNDVSGVNASQDVRLSLVSTGDGSFVYESDRFFPIDGQLFAADAADPDRDRYSDVDGKDRNFHFTYELHTTFRYEKGNVFTFRGDDDVFVYIDDKLVVNLGGIHAPLQARVDLDGRRVEVTAPLGLVDLPLGPALGFTESIGEGVAAALPLDLTEGEEYTLDFFFAERNSRGSNFRLETNLVFVECGAGQPK
jgi:fibro-slime domain-containing protein